MYRLLVNLIVLLVIAVGYVPSHAADLVSDKTYSFLVLREGNFPQDRFLYSASPQEYKYFIEVGEKDLDAAGGQPFRVTSYTVNYSGKYALWVVTGTLEEMTHIDSMIAKGYIILLDEIYTSAGADGKVTAYPTHYADLPSDFYEVAISTGV